MLRVMDLNRQLGIWTVVLCVLGLLLASPAAAQTGFIKIPLPVGMPMNGASAAIALGDIDNDGWPDVVRTGVVAYGTGLFPTLVEPVNLLKNEGGRRFSDQSALFQGKVSTFQNTGILADYDNDGDLDLYVTSGSFFVEWQGVSHLLRNDRGEFAEVTQAAGLIGSQPSAHAIWLDYDRDGWVDLYVGDLGCDVEDPATINRLYRNQGDGTFDDMTAAAGLALSLTEDCGTATPNIGGMVGGDFNDDGWPDLYLGVFAGPNRLFLNNGHGGFRDATTGEIADPGTAAGVAVGDIDNDGDLEILQASGGFSTIEELSFPQYRTVLLLNLGQGQFLDTTEGVGLSTLSATTSVGANLMDVDNDGDLDLTTGGAPGGLFLNDGGGFFPDSPSQVDNTPLVAADFDLDGALDGGCILCGPMVRNTGSDNHWLRVELVGTKSNRSGINARLTATSGKLQQMREILGGRGEYQDEMLAHFGLGQHTRVDRLEIRWPSGQVDVLTDIPADQKIRVLEGSGRYYHVEPTRWQQTPPKTLVTGTNPHLSLAIQPSLFEPEARITRVTADLSALGGDAETALTEEGDGSYRLRNFPISVTAPRGIHFLHVLIDQHTSLGPYWTRLSWQVVVAPAEDLVIFEEALAQDWQVEGNQRVKKLGLSETSLAHMGSLSGAFEGEEGFPLWAVTFKPAAPVDLVGYAALRIAFNPGDVVPPGMNFGKGYFSVALLPSDKFPVSLLQGNRVDLTKKEWQGSGGPPGRIRHRNAD